MLQIVVPAAAQVFSAHLSRGERATAARYDRCAKLCGEVVYVEQIWLAGRTLARRTFARCLTAEHPLLPASARGGSHEDFVL